MRAFDRFAATCALLAAPAGFGYSTAFIVYLHNASRAAAYVDDLLLLGGGLLSTVVFTALFERFRPTDPPLALWGYVLALAGAFGAILHAGYDLANLVKPPAALASDVPSATDPRGLGTFALTGLALAVSGCLILRSRQLPVLLGYVAFLAAALLVFIYVGRLVILDPNSPGLHAAAVVSGFAVNPIFYGWLGVSLWRDSAAAATPQPLAV
jgi:hypothetical protein